MHDAIVKPLRLGQITLDLRTQPRTKIDKHVVDEYAHDLYKGAIFPPVIVYHDGQRHWLKSECQKLSQRIETDLVEQGVTLFPVSKTGERARDLSRRLKPDLLRGGAIEITRSALRLDLHREELRRVKTVLVNMSLIKPRSDGRYVLGDVGPCGAIDELIRDEFLNFKLLEDVVMAFAAITKSKTR